MNHFIRFQLCLSFFLSFQAQELFVLPRVNMPDQVALDRQQHDQYIRSIVKYSKGASATIGMGLILYFAYQVHQLAIHQEMHAVFVEKEKQTVAAEKKRIVGYLDKMSSLLSEPISAQFLSEPTIEDIVMLPTTPGLVGKVTASLKSFGLSTSKFAADSLLLLVSGSVANYVYDFMKTKINQTFAPESVSWYVLEQTKLSWLFTDLKTCAVDYDLHASVLSAELFNQDAQIHMKALLKDLHQSMVRNYDMDDMQSSAYWNYLFDEVKKKYIKKSSHFEQRQDYVDMAVIKQHRAAIEQDALFLFVQDMNRRQTVSQFCTFFAHDMQRLIDFIAFKIHMKVDSDQTGIVSELVDMTNKFLSHMEMLLSATLDELTILSKQDQGMFTAIYEFEKIFNEQMNFLHRYCKYNL